MQGVGSLFENALKDIVSDVAYRSVADGKPVVAAMEHARQQLEKLRTKAGIQGRQAVAGKGAGGRA